MSWWREGDTEVDFVLHAGRQVTAIEVESAFSAPPRGLEAFRARIPRAHAIVAGAGSGAIPSEAFLARPAADWLG